MRVRKATKNDIESIVMLNKELADMHHNIDRIYKEGQAVATSFKKYLESIIDKENVLVIVAELDDKVVGYMIGVIEQQRPFLNLKKAGRISDAYVDENYRNRGIGKAMFEELKSWFKKNGINFLTLSVDVRNKDGYAFWKKMGFEEWMVRMKMKI